MNPVDSKVIKSMQDVSYFVAVACLMHAMTHTRPDIAYVVGQVAKFMANPGHMHWSAVKRIMRYLKQTLHYRIIYKCESQPTTYLHQI
jgi:hypothetical protein